MGNKTPSKWPLIFILGFAAVVVIAASAQKNSCTTCPIVQMIKGIKSCATAEPNATAANPEPNTKPAESNQ
jgi:hypothetical protein